MTPIGRRGFLASAASAMWAARCGSAWAKAPSGLIVDTSHGKTRGRADNGIRVFTGIPYGWAHRFSAPRPAARWAGVLDATGLAAVAPQAPGMVKYAGTVSEDCLHLNIWAPEHPGPHPVLVYIHGGGNETGWSGETGTAGDRFAANGVVCVTVNYRLGALGFLELGELLGQEHAGSANNAMRDLVLALRWVQANIAGFGGDPARVTIAGESAGGKNVGTLMGIPLTDGLYSGAALFSGGAQTVHNSAEARAFAALFVQKLGGVERLRTVSVDAIIAAQLVAKAAWPHNFPFRPLIDGHLLPYIPLARIYAGDGPRVPIMIGSNADESRLFLPPAVANAPLSQQHVSHESMARMAALDQAYAHAFPHLSTTERHWRLLTAEEYGMPCLRIAEGHAARGGPVYRYRLTYPAPGGRFAGHSPHALDLPFTFDHLADPGFKAFFGLSAADQPMADAMHQAMVRFVHDGRPAAPGLPIWERYEATTRQTVIWNRAPTLESDPDRAERLLWQA